MANSSSSSTISFYSFNQKQGYFFIQLTENTLIWNVRAAQEEITEDNIDTPSIAQIAGKLK